MTHSMIQGYLKILVFKALEEGPKSGYSLMKYVQGKTGAKPSPGSIYPLLEQLKKEKLVEVKGVGRANEYKLTPAGKQKVALIEEKRQECIQTLVNSMKMMSALTGEDFSMPQQMIESMQKGEEPFKELNPELSQLQAQFLTMYKKGTITKNAAKIRKILSNALREMRAL
ncbi:MAG: PadR family transcriptional regulator [Candidatus Woesearchaeota archaeon]